MLENKELINEYRALHKALKTEQNSYVIQLILGRIHDIEITLRRKGHSVFELIKLLNK